MNKTVTINIAGLVFHIEEDAYARLHSYLESLRMKFSAEEGRDEILADIESRIAEILTEKKGPNREVVLMKDIEEVIAVMGEPEAISDDGSTPKEEEQPEEKYERRGRRRLFRDPDDKMVGGVCAGIGHYFDIDPVWLRLGFVLAVILGGTGVLFYLLLMIVIPKAVTTAEKLEMRGDPVDVNNIKRTIQDEMEEFGERMKNYGKRKKHEWGKAHYDHRNRTRYHRRRADAEDFLYNIARVLGRFLAFCLVVFGIFLLIGLLTGTFAITDVGPDMISYQVEHLFDDSGSYYLGIAAGLLVFGIPILMMIYSGIAILFKLKRNNKILGFSALGFWIMGIVFAIISIINVAEGFSFHTEVPDYVAVQNAHRKEVKIRVDIDPNLLNEDYDESWGRRYHYGHRWRWFAADSNDVKLGTVNLNIVPAHGDSIELVVFKTAQGRTAAEANERVRDIRYSIQQDSTTITFSSCFTIGDTPIWKAQNVDAELRIPVGTSVFIDRTCKGLLYDVDNVTDTYDDDMVDRRWEMTQSGLKCIDCAGLELPPTYNTNPVQTAPANDTIINHDTIVIPKY